MNILPFYHRGFRHLCHGQTSRFLGDKLIPTFNRNPYFMGPYKPLLLGWFFPSPIIWKFHGSWSTKTAHGQWVSMAEWLPTTLGLMDRGAAPEPSDLPKPSAEASKVLQRPSPARPVILQKPTHLGVGIAMPNMKWIEWEWMNLFLERNGIDRI